MSRVLCVWFPDWPIQRVRSAQPELRGTAVVLYSEQGSRGQRVTCCSIECRKAGVAAGMPVAEARTLLEGRGRTPRFVSIDPPADREALRRLSWELLRYSPQVGLEDADEPESILLDVSGCTHLFGGEAGLLLQVRRDLGERGFHVRLALADTIGAAWAASHYAADPVTCIRADAQRAFVENLPVAALRLSVPVQTTMAELGLETVGQVVNLPRESLPSRFGPEVLRRLDQAFGTRAETIAAERPPEPIEFSESFEVALENRHNIEGAVRKLLGRVLDQLHARGLGTQRIEIRLAHETGPETPLEIGLVSATASAKRLEEVFRLTWERADVREAVVGATVRAIESVVLPICSGTLFETGNDAPASEWVALLERLSNRLGEQAVLRMELVADDVPERAFRDVPVTAIQDRQPSRVAASACPAPIRPLCFLATPRSLHVLGDSDGVPRHLRSPGLTGEVAHAWGPERIESGWWRDHAVRRDYFRIEMSDGARLWVYRDRTTARWFLHGTFE